MSLSSSLASIILSLDMVEVWFCMESGQTASQEPTGAEELVVLMTSLFLLMLMPMMEAGAGSIGVWLLIDVRVQWWCLQEETFG